MEGNKQDASYQNMLLTRSASVKPIKSPESTNGDLNYVYSPGDLHKATCGASFLSPYFAYKPFNYCPWQHISGHRNRDSSIDTKFRVFSTSLLGVLQRWVGRRLRSNLTDAQRRGLKEVRELTATGALKVSISDKGGEFVILSQDLDRAITALHLQDHTTYHRSSPEEFARQYRHLNRKWSDIAKTANLPRSLILRLKCDHPISPVLYVLIKTHKISSPEDMATNDPTAFKIRPIVSSVGGPTDRISWFLNLILVQLFKFIPSH